MLSGLKDLAGEWNSHSARGGSVAKTNNTPEEAIILTTLQKLKPQSPHQTGHHTVPANYPKNSTETAIPTGLRANSGTRRIQSTLVVCTRAGAQLVQREAPLHYSVGARSIHIYPTLPQYSIPLTFSKKDPYQPAKVPVSAPAQKFKVTDIVGFVPIAPISSELIS